MPPDEVCELPDSNPPDPEIRELLARARTVAVVGLSADPEKDSHRVARYLQEQGFRILPVNPKEREILGQKSYASLREIPEKVDVVDIFRRPEAIPGIVDEAIAIGAGAVWMQLGLAHGQAARKAREAGLAVVQDRCMKIEHQRLVRG